MSQPPESPEPVATRGQLARSPRPRRHRRAMGWLLLGLSALVIIAYVQTATDGTQAVRASIQAEALAGYRSLKSRSPRAVTPGFAGPEIESCRAVLPGFVACTYSVTYGRKAASGYKDLYLWDGRKCRRLRHALLWVA